LGIVISTRSPDPTSPLEELIAYGADVAAGVIDDPAFASFVWSAPIEADAWAPATWMLANPDADAVRNRGHCRAGPAGATVAIPGAELPRLLSEFASGT